MLTITGISGSTRRGSFNSSLLRALAAAAPQEAQVRIESIAAIPLYNGDEEAAHGVPGPVARLKDAIASADALLFVTPEYNNTVPGVAKNAIDWCTRPPADVPRVFGGKPVALAGASPGGFGTILSQNAWLPVFRTLGASLYPGKLLVSRAGSVFDAGGNITDAAVKEASPSSSPDSSPMSGVDDVERIRAASESDARLFTIPVAIWSLVTGKHAVPAGQVIFIAAVGPIGFLVSALLRRRIARKHGRTRVSP